MPVKQRQASPDYAFPQVTAAAEDAVQAWLETSYAAKRPPVVAAKVLAMVCELARRGMAFPPREQLAEHLGCTKWGIDAAISTALARELLSIRIETEMGHIRSRDNAVQLKHYDPSDELVAAYESGIKRRRVA